MSTDASHGCVICRYRALRMTSSAKPWRAKKGTARWSAHAMAASGRTSSTSPRSSAPSRREPMPQCWYVVCVPSRLTCTSCCPSLCQLSNVSAPTTLWLGLTEQSIVGSRGSAGPADASVGAAASAAAIAPSTELPSSSSSSSSLSGASSSSSSSPSSSSSSSSSRALSSCSSSASSSSSERTVSYPFFFLPFFCFFFGRFFLASGLASSTDSFSAT
mmetsp:Transcript_30686/g.65951  ORF Transcript_30686/g.65951 Transcript_30686/m.65951 type:complete len:217 (-) Transcript_30686:1963-2613(-)